MSEDINNNVTFRTLFFRLYDRQIASGACTFGQLGIPKSDFTTMCTNKEFRMKREIIVNAINKMKLSDSEASELIKKYDEEEPKD